MKPNKSPVNELRFLARMVSDNPDFKDRNFSIIFSLVDDEVKVWENKSDGFVPGFIYKSPRKPEKEVSKYSEMYVGSVVDINGMKFELYDAPENTFQEMSSNPDMFEQMNINLILPKLKMIKTKLEVSFRDVIIPGTDRVTLDDTKKILENCGVELSKSQIIAILRKFRFFHTKTFDVKELLHSLD